MTGKGHATGFTPKCNLGALCSRHISLIQPQWLSAYMYWMEVWCGLSLIIFLLLCIPFYSPMKDSWNTASILLLPPLLCFFSPRRLSHVHARIHARFTDETQFLRTGFVDQVYIKEAGKKGGIIIYLERQFMSLRRILLFCCTVTWIVCMISAAYRNTIS